MHRARLFALGGAVSAMAGCLLSVSTTEDPSPPLPDAAPSRDAPAERAEPKCPVGLPGPALVLVVDSCMDATEVSNGDYAAFLSAAGDGGAPAVPSCAFSASRVPAARWPPSSATLGLPVTGIDWCSAASFCMWAGKRLCGRIGGTPAGFEEALDPTLDEWSRACTAAGKQPYPYGPTFDSSRCFTPHAIIVGKTPVVVGSMPLCEGGFPGLFDLSGNVWEWEDACDGSSGAVDPCRIRGGSYRSNADNVGCFGVPDMATSRGLAREDIGFRCCARAE